MWRATLGSLLALAGCSTTTATPSATTVAILTPAVLAEVDRTLIANRGDEIFAYERVEADGRTLVVRTGLHWNQENAELALGLCRLAAGGLMDAGAESASVRVVAANGDNLALTMGPAGKDGRMAGNCRRSSAFNRG